MSDLIQTFKGTALSVAEYFTPVLSESKFKKTGVLTPEEFVLAGDHLVHQCPTWSWSGSGNGGTHKSYLPPGKQFLITKSVPCYKRCKDIEYNNNEERLVLTENDDEGWVDTHHSEQLTTVNDLVEEMTLCDDKHQTQQTTPSSSKADEMAEDDEAEDMDKYMNMVEDEDTSVAPTNQPHGQSLQASNKESDTDRSKDNIVATRTYDLHITYDKYYRTPRLWLVGYDESLKPLSINQMYEDISQDHAKKTVTMETHPHISTVMASVHPCRHAEVMKRIMTNYEEGGKELQVTSYLIIFLKFVQSVIPTIEYDFTQNFTM